MPHYMPHWLQAILNWLAGVTGLGAAIFLLNRGWQAWEEHRKSLREFRIELAQSWLEFVDVMDAAYAGRQIQEMEHSTALVVDDSMLKKMREPDREVFESLYRQLYDWRMARIWVAGGYRLRDWEEWLKASSSMRLMADAMVRLRASTPKSFRMALRGHLHDFLKHHNTDIATRQALERIEKRLDELGLLED